MVGNVQCTELVSFRWCGGLALHELAMFSMCVEKASRVQLLMMKTSSASPTPVPHVACLCLVFLCWRPLTPEWGLRQSTPNQQGGGSDSSPLEGRAADPVV